MRSALESSDVLLTDGAVVTIRPVQASDEAALTDLYERTASESLRLRFFTYSDRAGHKDVERMLRPRSGDHEALVALDQSTVLGVGCIEATDKPGTAEFAMLVDDSHHGNGIGMLLLEQLVGAARSLGYRRLRADVLAENLSMLHVLRDLGAEVHEDLAHAVVEVEFAVADRPAWRLAVEDRESIAEHASLDRVLAPRSIAVVGAGRSGIGHRILANLVSGGFTGDLFAINRSGAEVSGIPGVGSLRALPRPPDLAIIAVPAPEVPAVIEDCASIGVYGAVIVSDGFAELGAEGKAQQAAILATARRAGMRLVGPNCLGIVNANETIRMNGTFAETRPVAGSVGLASQSGGVGLALLDYLTRRRIGLSTFVSMGNKADVSGNDLLMYWERDSDTRVCVLYLESFGNARKFARVARRVARVKPVIAVTAGRSSAGARGVKSHTAAAATPDVAINALFAQAGVMRAESLSEVMDIVSIVTDAPLPGGRRIGIVTNGGGPGALAADASAAAGLVVPELSTETRIELARILPPHAATGNPIDSTAGGDPSVLAAAADLLMRSGEVDIVMVVHTSLSDTDTDTVAESLAQLAAERPAKTLVGVFLGRLEAPEPLQRNGAGSLIPCFAFPETAATALGAVVGYADWRRTPEPRPPLLRGIHRRAARELVAAFLHEQPDGGWLDTDRAAALVASYGVPVVTTVRANTAAEAVAAATEIGYPVVIKAAGGAVLHRTDIGGVKLDLQTPDDVLAAVAAIQEACGGDSGVVVQPMLAAGVETAVGIVNDPAVGPIEMFALGGVATDLLADRSFRLPPLGRAEVKAQIRSLRAAPLLFGYRGAEPVDEGALADVLLRVGQLAVEVPELAELDLNPVLASPTGACAVDVKVRLAPAGGPDPFLRRLSPGPSTARS